MTQVTQALYTGIVEPSGGGDGVSGATVNLLNPDTDVVFATTTSGDGGAFSVSAEDQDVTFSASKAGAGELVVTNVNVDTDTDTPIVGTGGITLGGGI
jgi:hypothetical protein